MTGDGVRYVVGLVLLAAVAGCGGPAKAQQPKVQGPMPAAELRTRLLPAALPGGWASVADRPDGKAQGGAAASVPPPACEGLLDGQTVVDATTAAASASATAAFSGGHTVDNGVISGAEKLYSFPGDGAHRAMRDMRELVARCASVDLRTAEWEPPDTAGFAVADGPRLGDESLVVRGTVTDRATGRSDRADATVVRVGSSLVVISTVLTLTPAEMETVMAFMPAAVAQFSSERPEPVDAAAGG
ncbi:hypothetical protein [Streptomyces sp. NBC_00096]|uniref:hypothetical protein n=1 Tax=Streptomyces sp. NBC_00096 TaxID=2975650 RepID=UPI003250080C